MSMHYTGNNWASFEFIRPPFGIDIELPQNCRHWSHAAQAEKYFYIALEFDDQNWHSYSEAVIVK